MVKVKNPASGASDEGIGGGSKFDIQKGGDPTPNTYPKNGKGQKGGAQG